MTTVFLLVHESEEDDFKVIGVFPTRVEAEQVVQDLSTKRGFSDYPEGFDIGPYPIGRVHFDTGFGVD